MTKGPDYATHVLFFRSFSCLQLFPIVIADSLLTVHCERRHNRLGCRIVKSVCLCITKSDLLESIPIEIETTSLDCRLNLGCGKILHNIDIIFKYPLNSADILTTTHILPNVHSSGLACACRQTSHMVYSQVCVPPQGVVTARSCSAPASCYDGPQVNTNLIL